MPLEIQTRVDRASLEAGTGIHPLSPGVPATEAREGPKARRKTAPASSCPASLFGKDRAIRRIPDPTCGPRVHRGPIGADSQPVGTGVPASRDQCERATVRSRRIWTGGGRKSTHQNKIGRPRRAGRGCRPSYLPRPASITPARLPECRSTGRSEPRTPHRRRPPGRHTPPRRGQ